MDHRDCPAVSSKPSDPQQRRPDGRMYFVETAEQLGSYDWQRSQMLSTGDIRDWDAVVDQVLRCLVLKALPAVLRAVEDERFKKLLKTVNAFVRLACGA